MQQPIAHRREHTFTRMRQIRRFDARRADDHAHQHRRPEHTLCPARDAALAADDVPERMAEPLDAADGHEQAHEDRADAAVLPPRDLLIEQQADAAGADIAEDSAVAHIRLEQVERVCQVAGGDLRHDGARIGPCRGHAHGAQRAVGRERQRFDVLVRQTRHDGQCEERDGNRAGKRAETEQERRQQRKDERRERTQHLHQKPQDAAHRCRARQIRRAQRREDERQQHAQRRAGDGHAQRGQQRRDDRGQIAPVRREELRGNVAQVRPPRPEYRGVAPREPERQHKQREHTQRPRPALAAGARHGAASLSASP